MTFYNRNGMLYARINGKRVSTKLEYSKENIKLFKSYAKNEEFFKKFDVMKKIPTVVDLCKEVLEDKKDTLKRTSYTNYLSMLNSRIIPFFNKRKVTEIKPLDILEFYKTFTDRSALVICEAILRPSFEKAVLGEIINQTPMRISKPKFKDTGYEINPFTKDELQKILDYNDDRLCNFIAISCFTGLRTGEMLGLRWCDVDLNNMTISVKQQFTRCFLQTPKTKKSMSTIELPIEALPFFERQRYKTGLREYVFYSPKNKEPWKSSYYINTLFKEMLRKLDIPERTIYQTRHTFASIRLTMGEKLEWVSYMMRHENTSITLKKYFKYIKELDVKRVDLNFDLTQKRHTC
ncbi:site-specific integrase [Aliarcobacter butzleri]|uniref:Tyr recombinase domain-containing protein n=1 Tax=Arcobacter lacus TaxID=1912876 RepID=A0ABX5JJ78_9BACT|nr:MULTISPECIES: site-specific integrase [Arcobacteraceae]MCT7549853.1 site-specific integrase [Aliarcobacter butzleri]MCT7560115.1 site-specific integrase [Aliarcobacter butzleri]MCT7614694.1 site-specific integrase [Aliarcobacter butzleri]PUE67409.1 hypothetical protein B0175_00050 [Arcobacter lacus]